MKKNDLIKMLQELDGNPDIMVWNGFVGDFMPVGDIGTEVLVKMSQSHVLEMCRLEMCRDKKDWTLQLSDARISEIKSSYREYHKFEFNEFVTDEDIKSKRYTSKKIVYIQPSKSGKRYSDRLGSVDY